MERNGNGSGSDVTKDVILFNILKLKINRKFHSTYMTLPTRGCRVTMAFGNKDHVIIVQVFFVINYCFNLMICILINNNISIYYDLRVIVIYRFI
jgi:hypothetical protein